MIYECFRDDVLWKDEIEVEQKTAEQDQNLLSVKHGGGSIMDCGRIMSSLQFKFKVFKY